VYQERWSLVSCQKYEAGAACTSVYFHSGFYEIHTVHLYCQKFLLVKQETTNGDSLIRDERFVSRRRVVWKIVDRQSANPTVSYPILMRCIVCSNRNPNFVALIVSEI